MDSELLSGHLQELRRGTVVLACLVVLERPGYGYGLLEQLNAAGIDVDANTLYPLLRRLEKQGLLTSEWVTDEPRPRKFYRVSDDGRSLAASLTADWAALTSALDALHDQPVHDQPVHDRTVHDDTPHNTDDDA